MSGWKRSKSVIQPNTGVIKVPHFIKEIRDALNHFADNPSQFVQRLNVCQRAERVVAFICDL